MSAPSPVHPFRSPTFASNSPPPLPPHLTNALISGPPFFRALSTTLGSSNLAVQGISYPASVAGFLAGGDAAGSRLMAQLVAQVQTQCPTTKLVMSGYSQGGQLVHKAAALLTAAQGKFVSSGMCSPLPPFPPPPPRADSALVFEG
jgi:hypothetical protein